jgi:glycerophosphoryl diester phosphodiesterase
VGIYPELKQPSWHRGEGRDISAAVLPILRRYGYATKADPCFLQCFELTEVKRLRGELGWQGQIIMLINGRGKETDGVDHDALSTPEGLKGLVGLADGVGPAIGRIVTWGADGKAKLSPFAAAAHALGLVMHPYTIRLDELPRNCPSADALHDALFRQAGVEGVFSDFTDVTRTWLLASGLRRP